MCKAKAQTGQQAAATHTQPSSTSRHPLPICCCARMSSLKWGTLSATESKDKRRRCFHRGEWRSLHSDSVSRSFLLEAVCALSMHFFFFFFYWTCLFVSVKQQSAINLSRNRAKVGDATWAIWKIYSGSHSETVAVVALVSWTQCINCSASWCVVQARLLGLLCTSTSWSLFVTLSSNLDLHPQTHGLCCAVLLAHDDVLHCGSQVLVWTHKFSFREFRTRTNSEFLVWIQRKKVFAKQEAFS